MKLTYQTTTQINKPLEEVYDAIANYKKAPLWLSSLKKVEPLSGIPGEAGFKSRYTFVENGRVAIFDEEVTKVVPYQFFEHYMESKDVILEGHTQFNAVNGGTQIVVSNQVKAKSFWMKLMFPFLKGMMKKRQEQDFKNLKELVENEQS